MWKAAVRTTPKHIFTASRLPLRNRAADEHTRTSTTARSAKTDAPDRSVEQPQGAGADRDPRRAQRRDDESVVDAPDPPGKFTVGTVELFTIKGER